MGANILPIGEEIEQIVQKFRHSFRRVHEVSANSRFSWFDAVHRTIGR